MTNKIVTCIMLHDMCTIGKDKLDMNWMKEVKNKLEKTMRALYYLVNEKEWEKTTIGQLETITITKNNAWRI